MEISTVARPYAKAAFAFAMENSQLAHWSKMLETLSLIASDESMRAFLGDPTSSKEQRVSAVCDIADSAIDQYGRNLVATMSEKDRLELLPSVYEQFEILKADKENSKDITVVSAYPLSDPELEQLKKKLSKQFSSEVNVDVEVDKDLIGGLIVKSEGMVIDGSIRGRLKKLADTLCG